MSTTEIQENGQQATTNETSAPAEPQKSPQQKSAETRSKNRQERVVTLDEEEKTSHGSVTEDVKAVRGENHDDQLSGEKVRVTFFEDAGDGGSDAIFASLNGYAFQIPRNVPVDIPVELLEVFANAKTDIVETAQGGGSRKRTINRYSYTVHGKV